MKIIICIFVSVITFAGGSRVVTFKEVNNEFLSKSNLSMPRIDALRSGDYLQIDNKDEYVLKTVSRNLLVDDFKLVNKFRKILNELDSKISQLEETMEDYDRNELLNELEISIKPFEVDDF